MEPLRFTSLRSAPTVSVVIANYNYGRFLPDAVDSVRDQTYPHWELLICDDGSTDQSRAVIDEYSRLDARVRGFFKDNGGQASAWNLVLAHTTGEIVCFLDADDVWLPEKLDVVVKAYGEQPDAGFVYHRFQPVTRALRPIGAAFPRELEEGWLADIALTRGGWGPGSVASVMSFRRELVEHLLPIPEKGRGFGDTFIQAVSQFLVEIVAIPNALTLYRVHGANAIGSARPEVRELRRMVDAQRDTFEDIRSFARSRLGESVASRLRIENVTQHWEYLAGLFIMLDKPRGGVDGHDSRALLAHLPHNPRRHIWRVLFVLPRPLARYAFSVWWGTGWWKRLARPVTRLLRLG